MGLISDEKLLGWIIEVNLVYLSHSLLVNNTSEIYYRDCKPNPFYSNGNKLSHDTVLFKRFNHVHIFADAAKEPEATERSQQI